MGKKFDGQNLMLIISLFLILMLSYCSIPSRDDLQQPAEPQETEYLAQDSVDSNGLEAPPPQEIDAQVEESAELEDASVEVEEPAEVEEIVPEVQEPAEAEESTPAEGVVSEDGPEAVQAAVEGEYLGMPAVIAMDNSIYETHTKGIVQFSHQKHLADYGIGCGECHHDDDGTPLADMQLGDDAVGCAECHSEPGTAPKSKDKKLSDSERREYHAEALHDSCIPCHRDHNKKNNTKDAPASCAKCHPKKS